MEKLNGKRVMQSALDQWAVVERIKTAAKQLVPPAQADMMDRCVAEKADRSLQLLDKTKSKRTPTDDDEEDTTDSPTEEELRSVLFRLQGTSSGAK